MLCELPEFQHIDAHDVAKAVECLSAHEGRARVIPALEGASIFPRTNTRWA
ncbi:MAG: hypothetical protein H6Q55_2361 [Deltaproteobacteria bacterium]|jgi:hypothetical protein|nr:hypothetical protein [Deltaproteobacteria bacterium]